MRDSRDFLLELSADRSLVPRRQESAASMRVLIVMQGANFFRNLEPLVRELDARGHAIVVLHPNRHDDASVDDARLRAKLARKHERRRERSKQKFALMERSIEVARADIPRVVIDYRPEPTERWHRRLREGRKVINLSIYLRKDHPAPERLAEDLEKMLSPKTQRLLRLQLARTLLARRSILRFWRWVEGASPPSRTVLDVLAKFRPDVVLVSPTIAAKNPVEADYIRGARSLGIPTLGYVNSWDNLTSKGTVHLVPDALVVWNEAIAREAVEIHDIPRAAVQITGAPHFDYFFDMRPTRNRAEVRQQMGCEGDTPYVVYLCSSRTIIASEVNIVTALADALADRFPGAPPTLVVRPHPVNATVWDDYVHAGVVVHPKGGDQADS
ncbi:MAG: hypothetical protein M3R12_05720, partial [Actinomycetota bacterium]|nr:hypothetical protein [Actinomycetota bacterium]